MEQAAKAEDKQFKPKSAKGSTPTEKAQAGSSDDFDSWKKDWEDQQSAKDKAWQKDHDSRWAELEKSKQWREKKQIIFNNVQEIIMKLMAMPDGYNDAQKFLKKAQAVMMAQSEEELAKTWPVGLNKHWSTPGIG